MTTFDLPRQLLTYKQRADQNLLDYLPQAEPSHSELIPAMRYSALLGGKRIRPALVFATGAMLNTADSDQNRIAAAIELIHAYSLIHDDLPAMDDDDLRRGQPTCHLRFSEATAILAGDALQTLAFSIMCQPMSVPASKQLEIISILSNASGYRGMAGGQALDLAATNKSISLNYLEQMHRQKTGALITASIVMSAMCSSNVTETHIQALTQYGDAIGLAFQVKDDLLDIEGDTASLGKPQGSDVQQAKSTYPAILGLTGARDKANQLYQEALDCLADLPYDTRFLAEFARYIIERNS